MWHWLRDLQNEPLLVHYHLETLLILAVQEKMWYSYKDGEAVTLWERLRDTQSQWNWQKDSHSLEWKFTSPIISLTQIYTFHYNETDHQWMDRVWLPVLFSALYLCKKNEWMKQKQDTIMSFISSMQQDMMQSMDEMQPVLFERKWKKWHLKIQEAANNSKDPFSETFHSLNDVEKVETCFKEKSFVELLESMSFREQIVELPDSLPSTAEPYQEASQNSETSIPTPDIELEKRRALREQLAAQPIKQKPKSRRLL